ncbi:MAG: hypothetical protein IIY85_02240, partial [Lachnospiraceae bacterium]|nr:hypothetical protein [Lachnospiraceae bacterium]
MGYIPEGLVCDRALIQLRVLAACLLRLKGSFYCRRVSSVGILSLLQNSFSLRLLDVLDEPFRGNHYAEKACRLLFELARRHEMDYLIISCQPTNLPS